MFIFVERKHKRSLNGWSKIGVVSKLDKKFRRDC